VTNQKRIIKKMTQISKLFDKQKENQKELQTVQSDIQAIMFGLQKASLPIHGSDRRGIYLSKIDNGYLYLLDDGHFGETNSEQTHLLIFDDSDAVFKYGADKLCSLISGALDKIVTVLESSEKYVTERMVAEGIAKARSGAIGMEDEE